MTLSMSKWTPLSSKVKRAACRLVFSWSNLNDDVAKYKLDLTRYMVGSRHYNNPLLDYDDHNYWYIGTRVLIKSGLVPPRFDLGNYKYCDPFILALGRAFTVDCVRESNRA